MADTLSQYTLRQMLLTTVTVMAALLLVVWMTQAPRLIALVVNQGLSIGAFFTLTLWVLPALALAILPVASLISVLHIYARMLGDREIIIMRVAGLDNLSIARPAIFVSLLVSGLTIALSFHFVPASQRNFFDLEESIRHDFSALVVREGHFNSVGRKLTIYVRNREKNGVLQGILVHDRRKRGEKITLMAKRGVIIDSATGKRIVLFDGNQQTLKLKNNQVSYVGFDAYHIDFGAISKGARRSWRRASELSLSELLWPKGKTAAERNLYKKFIAAGHNRIVISFLPVGLTLVALICLLCGEYNKRGQNKRVLLAIGISSAIQGGAFGLHFLAADATELVPLMYINAIVPIIVGTIYLGRGRLQHKTLIHNTINGVHRPT